MMYHPTGISQIYLFRVKYLKDLFRVKFLTISLKTNFFLVFNQHIVVTTLQQLPFQKSPEILKAADNGELSLLILLDLSSAFDLVNHKILLKRLEKSWL